MFLRRQIQVILTVPMTVDMVARLGAISVLYGRGTMVAVALVGDESEA